MESQPKGKDNTGTEGASHEEAHKGPFWSDSSESGRVRATIWKHENKNGKVRYTVGICRSYLDRDDDRWVNTHYYDQRDLDDVMHFAQVAKKKLDRIIDGVAVETE